MYISDVQQRQAIPRFRHTIAEQFQYVAYPRPGSGYTLQVKLNCAILR